MSTVSQEFSGRKVLHTADGRIAGVVLYRDGTCVVQKTADPKLHLLRKPLAWAWDKGAFDEAAERLGARRAVVKERAGNRQWTALVSAFREYGFVFDRGHGIQIGLPLRYWSVEGPQNPSDTQLQLFGEDHHERLP